MPVILLGFPLLYVPGIIEQIFQYHLVQLNQIEYNLQLYRKKLF